MNQKSPLLLRFCSWTHGHRIIMIQTESMVYHLPDTMYGLELMAIEWKLLGFHDGIGNFSLFLRL